MARLTAFTQPVITHGNIAANAFVISSSNITNPEYLFDGISTTQAQITASPATVTVDLGSATLSNIVGIFGHNTADFTSVNLKIEHSADNVTYTEATNFNLDSSGRPDTKKYGSNITKRFWKLTFTITGSATQLSFSGGTFSTTGEWQDILYAENLWVACSDAGASRIATSADNGATWTSRSAYPDAFKGITHDGTTFVAIGSGNSLVSADGLSWSNYSLPESNTWESVTNDGTTFVAVSSDGTNRVITSADGQTWTTRTAAEANSWKEVIWVGDLSLFIAVSSDGTNRVMTSADGITWTARSAPASNWNGIAYQNGVVVATSPSGSYYSMYSFDGINWTASPTTKDFQGYGLSAGGGYFLKFSVSSAGFAYSTDGITWITGPLPSINPWTKAAYNDGIFVVVAEDAASDSVIYTSSKPLFVRDVSITNYIDLPEGVATGFIEPKYNDRDSITANRTIAGHFAGYLTKEGGYNLSFDLRYLTDAWIRTNADTLIADLKQYPFYFIWNELNTDREKEQFFGFITQVPIVKWDKRQFASMNINANGMISYE